MVRAATLSGSGDPDPHPFWMQVFLVTSWRYRPCLSNLEHDDLQWFFPDALEGLLDVIDARLPGLIREIIKVASAENDTTAIISTRKTGSL